MAGVHRYEQRQLSLDLGQEVDPHVFQIDEAGEHGEVFTRRWVVELILDLSGFTADRDLGGMVAVEPSCGSGAFLAPMTERLIESCRIHDRPLADIRTALRAFDLLPVNAELAQKTVAGALIEAGLGDTEAKSIASDSVQCGDFLLTPHGEDVADFVLGNPPYIRLEDVPSARSAAYRRACPTMRGRSDIFVGFIEMGLRILKPDGVLGFIVADRWMHNQYGADLRRLVSSSYAVEAVVSMHDVDAFEEPVSAYPAVTIIRRARQSTAVVANATKAFGEASAPSLTKWVGSRSKSVTTKAVSAVKLSEWFDSELSWPSGDPANLALVADLERRFPPLQDPATGTRVGIGVASGDDSVFLTDDTGVVEPDRLLPLLMTRDTTIRRGEVVRHTPRQPVAGRTTCRPRRLPTSRSSIFVGTPVKCGTAMSLGRIQPPGTERSTESTRSCRTGTSWSSPISRPSSSLSSIEERPIPTMGCISSRQRRGILKSSAVYCSRTSRNSSSPPIA